MVVWMRREDERVRSNLFVLLIITDLMLIGVHVLHTFTPLFHAENYAINKDRGFAETVQYVKEFWIATMFVLLAIRFHRPFYLLWAMIFSYLLIDDSFRVHEEVGARIVNFFHWVPMLHLRAQDFGEVAVSGVAGTFFISLILLTYYRGNQSTKGLCQNLLSLLLFLAIFGVGIDLLNIAFRTGMFGSILEDGGELLVMSYICAYVFQLYSQKWEGVYEPVLTMPSTWFRSVIRKPEHLLDPLFSRGLSTARGNRS